MKRAPGAQCVTGYPALSVAHTTKRASAANAGTAAGASRSDFTVPRAAGAGSAVAAICRRL